MANRFVSITTQRANRIRNKPSSNGFDLSKNLIEINLVQVGMKGRSGVMMFG